MFLKKEKALSLVCTVVISVFLLVGCGSDEQLPTSADIGDKGLAVPIIMYHSVINDTESTGDYVITPEMLRDDILYLQSNGYVTVSIGELIDYVNCGKSLPPKPVVLTFDDGYYNFLTEVMPILSDTNTKATLSVVGAFSKKEEPCNVQSSYYSYLTLEQIKQISKCGYVEIASHSYNFHSLQGRKGSMIMDGESYEEYRSRFLSDILTNKLLLEEYGVEMSIYTYPYGFICEESLELVKACDFKASLGVEERINYLTADTDCLYCMGRYNRPASMTTEDFMAYVFSE